MTDAPRHPHAAARVAILAAALQRIPFEGWTAQCVARATRDAGFEPTMAGRAFPHGVRDLLELFLEDADAQMVAALEKQNLTALPVRERIARAVRIRLEQQSENRETIRRAIALQATPQYVPSASRALARTVDLMWRAAGDSATDFNYYTKRGLLAGVYTSTTFYWLSDRSSGNAATWQFLDRRIENVMAIQKLRARFEKRLASLNPVLRRVLARHGSR